jgi:hypothetical protein
LPLKIQFEACLKSFGHFSAHINVRMTARVMIPNPWQYQISGGVLENPTKETPNICSDISPT